MAQRRVTAALAVAAGLIAASPAAARPSDERLLQGHRPLLRYQAEERYFAQPAADPRDVRRLDRDLAHGHVAREGGEAWLQYWLFFAQNTQDRGILKTGRHEGDWELVQVRLAGGGAIDAATYSQHASAEACSIGDLELAGEAPVVYVANGSHALYPRAGTADRPFPDPNDEADGEGRAVRPEVERVGNEHPAWIAFGGAWGSSHAGIVPGEQSSPVGPRFQESGAWQNPASYHDAARLCGSEPPGRWWALPALALALIAVGTAGVLLARRLRR